MFFRVTLRQKYEQSRNIVAKAVGSKPENLLFVENVTDGMNCVFTSMLRGYHDDDAVLITSLAYSAVTKTAVYHTKKCGVKLITLDIEFPVHSEEDICEAFRKVLKKNKEIKMAVFDHICSATAVMMPVQKIAAICREFGVMSVVDGAHAPGQLHLNLEDIGADVYIGTQSCLWDVCRYIILLQNHHYILHYCILLCKYCFVFLCTDFIVHSNVFASVIIKNKRYCNAY